MSRFSLNPPPVRSRTWILVLLGVIISLIALTSLVNYLVNPYATFEQDEECQMNCKTGHLISDRMTKFYKFNHSHAETIIMGTSRSGLFSPEILEPYAPKPLFNFSLAGSNIEEQAAYIRFAVTQGEVKHVLWALDFFSFNPTKAPQSDFKEERLSSSIYWPDYGVSLFNFGTLKNSFSTLKENYPFQKQSRKAFAKEAHSALREHRFSEQRLDANINHTLNEYAREKSFLNSPLMKEPSSLKNPLTHVSDIIALCEQNGATLHIYTSPVYKKHLSMYRELGLYESFAAWKKALSEMTDYTDFALCNSVTDEKQNFRDSSHIRSDYGYTISKIIYASADTNDFAKHVTSDNIDQHLKEQYKKCFD
ncbi:MAG: hypothetical protein ABFR02_07530 [Campylobacterota bacterium]